ncbi:MAG: hypothetical protein ACTHL8_20730 [Burkholderiaceae bacterium]
MPSISVPAYLRIVRASAVYDLAVTLMFATPWTLALAHAGLQATAAALGVAGLPSLDALHVLFANLMGIVVCVWALVRLRAPEVAFGRFDAGGRLGFAFAEGWALAHGASPLVAAFLVAELAFFVAQALPVRAPAAG